MTIKELCEWAVFNGVENLDIEIQHRDGRRYYNGSDTLHEWDITIDNLHAAVIL